MAYDHDHLGAECPTCSPFRTARFGLNPEHLLTDGWDHLTIEPAFPTPAVLSTPAALLPRHPTPSVCCALFRAGTGGADALLHLRADNGLWGLPGGALEWGESVEQAVRREMAEETGLTGFEVRRIVSVESDPACGALFTYQDGNTVHYVCVTVLAWMADYDASVAHLRASGESLALFWYPLEACPTSLPDPFSLVHQARLAAAWAALRGEIQGLPVT